MLSAFEIGEKIAIARKMKNLSQAQLSELAGVSAQAVGKWERGESMPDIIMFGRLSEIFGVDLNYFGSGEIPETLRENAPQETAQNTARKGWNMSGSNWLDADFSGLGGLAEKFSGANIVKCRFVGSELSGLTLRGNNIRHSDFTDSDLSVCKFSGVNLENSIFANCDLRGSALSGNNIMNCDFSGANLTNATYKRNNIREVKLTGTILRGTAFHWGQFTSLIFDGEITDCSFENCDFTRVEFRGAAIRNTFFKNCKFRRVKFTDCKTDRLSYAFIKSCKADMSGFEIFI